MINMSSTHKIQGKFADKTDSGTKSELASTKPTTTPEDALDFDVEPREIGAKKLNGIKFGKETDPLKFNQKMILDAVSSQIHNIVDKKDKKRSEKKKKHRRKKSEPVALNDDNADNRRSLSQFFKFGNDSVHEDDIE